ncbi:proline dehydrogenase family protein [Chryseolinea sp. T2]|uniref:proline dehydrogenase family protein n=1 Tax=Chryseolinea sp. T2 TaxID=3129255 RepID=UPI003077132D
MSFIFAAVIDMTKEAAGSFEDTEIAFRYKSNAAIRKANFIFSVVNHPWMSALATGAVKLALSMRLPVEPIIRGTVFDLFCGGESIERTDRSVAHLGKYGVNTILDYSVEGEDSDADFDRVRDEIIRTIVKASSSKNIPFSVFKTTGLGSSDILGKLNDGQSLSGDEHASFERTKERVLAICSKAHDLGVPVLVDAEETWIQTPIDQLAYDMMARFNRTKAIVFNTYQLYRADGVDNLKKAHAAAAGNYHLGAKLVRGAYMEKERARAESMGYPSPIHVDKAATDAAFNTGLEFCVRHHDVIALMCGSHNEYSNHYLTQLMNQSKLDPGYKRIWFAQLYGMSDNISFVLADRGYNVAKYMPYGPVRSVMPYLLRRAAENTSVAGQSSRELMLIRKELKRRKAAGDA